MKILKGSSDDLKLKEYYQKLLKFSIILAFEAISMNFKELGAIKFMENKPQMPIPPPEEVFSHNSYSKKAKR